MSDSLNAKSKTQTQKDFSLSQKQSSNPTDVREMYRFCIFVAICVNLRACAVMPENATEMRAVCQPQDCGRPLLSRAAFERPDDNELLCADGRHRKIVCKANQDMECTWTIVADECVGSAVLHFQNSGTAVYNNETQGSQQHSHARGRSNRMQRIAITITGQLSRVEIASKLRFLFSGLLRWRTIEAYLFGVLSRSENVLYRATINNKLAHLAEADQPLLPIFSGTLYELGHTL